MGKSSLWSVVQTTPSSKVVSFILGGRGQCGLSGGSSGQGKEGSKTKPSKLANLARSSRGAFEKKGLSLQKEPTLKFESVARLASLSAASRLPQSPADRVVVPENRLEVSPIRETRFPDAPISEHEPTEASTDPAPGRLLERPSLFANSLCHLWVVPQDAADILLRIHANPYVLTVSNESQLQKAFSTASPDDVVRNAQRRPKGANCCLWT